MATSAKAKAPARKPAAKKTPQEAGKLGGRPTKFKPEYLQQVRKLCLLGLTDEEIAAVWGVGIRTFHDWKHSQPGFAEALAMGKVVADAEVAHSLFQRAIGYTHPEVVITSYQGEITKTRVTRHYPPDTPAALRWLHNRQRSRWQHNPDPADGNDDPPPPAKVVIEVVDGRRPRTKPDAAAEPSAG
jgi:hypothetical protein